MILVEPDDEGTKDFLNKRYKRALSVTQETRVLFNEPKEPR